MNPKRRKLDSTISGSCSNVSPASVKEASVSNSLDPSLTTLTSSATADPKTVLKALSTLKEKLATRKEVLTFLDNSRPVFKVLVDLMKRSASEVLVDGGNPEYSERVLREVLSLIANLCHFSLAACVELNSSNATGLSHLYLRLLESGDKTAHTTKANVLRLLGNLCTWKQSLNLTSNTTLLDRIVSSTTLQEPALADKALRIVRYLSKRGSNSKALILSNTCEHIGNKLSCSPELIKDREDILHILINLLRFCPRDVGRQLVRSVPNCTAILFNHLLENTLSEDWKRLVLKLTHHSFEIREAFGEGAIQNILASATISSTHCEFLCSFAQDAWSRVILRESGALAIILDVLDKGQGVLQAKIIASLKHFIYDTQTMVYLCQRDSFIQVVLTHIRTYLAANIYKCRMDEGHQEDQEIEPKEIAEQKIGKTGMKEVEVEDHEKLHKDFLADWQGTSGGISPHLWSPSMSPNADSAHMLSAASSPSFAENSRASGSFIDNLGFAHGFSDNDLSIAFSPINRTFIQDSQEDRCIYSDEGEDPKEEESTLHLRAELVDAPPKDELPSDALPKEFGFQQQKIVARDCLEIITKLTHQEENYASLVKEDLLSTLLDVISDAPSFEAPLARSIKRLARSKKSLQTLLHMNFHKLVILKLIRRNCILARLNNPCSRCQIRLKFGQEVLQEFVGHVDSSLGWYLLQQELKADDPNTRLNAMMTCMVVIRQPERQNRLFQQFLPVEYLLSNLAHILHHEEFSQHQADVCGQILMSLSSLLSQRQLASLLPNFQQLRPSSISNISANCKLAGLDFADPYNLQFYSQTGECLAVVPKEELCEASAYFRGMFHNDFSEKTHNRQRFSLDEQDAAHCSETDYQKFMHYLLGCRQSACVQPLPGSTVCAMLYLADRYLCTALFEELLQAGGLAEKCMDGDSLQYFLVPVLSIKSIGDRLSSLCVFTLLRYTNTQQITAALSQFVGNPGAIADLIELLQTFLLHFTASVSENRQPQNSLVKLWDYL